MTAPPLKKAAATCLGKRRHPDEWTARAVGQHAIREYGNVEWLYVYRCPECHGWHLTRRPSGVPVGADDPYDPAAGFFDLTAREDFLDTSKKSGLEPAPIQGHN